MASLTELEQWEELIYQLETTDPVKGGDDGISNRQAKQLANRTKYLKKLILDAIGNDTNFAETVTSLLSQKVSIQDLQQGEYVFATDTGVENAYVCNLTPAITKRADGQLIRFKVKNTNSGASTINDGLGVVTLVGDAHSALQGGELVAGGIALAQWNGTVGSGSYVLLSCSSGALQVDNASKSKHAVNLGMFAASVTANGFFKVPVVDTDGSKKTFIVQFGIITTTAGTKTTHSFPIQFPNSCFICPINDYQSSSLTGATAYPAVSYILSTSQFECMATGASSTAQTFQFLAIGW